MSGHALNVRRLRFRGRLANPLAARGRVETALTAGADAARLGSEAILCVRRITISLPRLDHLSGSLDAEILNSAKPARGPVPANANAVLFADRAELLACLARDWCAGNTTARWWWSLLFPRDDFTAIVRRAWLEDGRPVPAALARLESVGLGARFLAKLSPLDVVTVWRNLVKTFNLPAHLDEAWSAIDLPAAAPAVVRGARDAPPWSPWITPDSLLTTDVARILITAILLERAPATVRSVSFAREVRAWAHAMEIRCALELTSRMFPLAEDSSTKDELPRSMPAPVILRSGCNVPPDATRFVPLTPPQPESAGAQTSAPPPLPQERFSRLRMAEDHSGPFEEGRPITPSAAATEESVALPSVALSDWTATKWGGTLYLVNVAIALELYGDFTNPARPGLALPLWDFLALLGGRMIGDEFAEDPLLRLFARLSGRAEDEPPGAQFEPPTGESLSIWLDRICHKVQTLVAASLGLGDDCDLRPLVLNHHAKIETTSARVDAHFSFATHPIELRVAGLDRDPGWVPAGGRSIYFHYE